MLYRSRRVSPIALITASGDRFIKLYGLAWEAPQPRDSLVSDARALALEHIPPATEGLPRCGFVTAHDGQVARWVLVDWWEKDLLHHLLFRGDRDQRGPLQPVHTSLTACVWELAITTHERNAWVRHVLGSDPPDVPGYLTDTLAGDV